jgi:hypothetical protein
MSGEENFVARWSRLKRKSAEPGRAGAEAEAPERQKNHPDAEQLARSPDAHPKPEPPRFDPDTLPPIDSLVAGSDIRAFLQKGVPAALTKAALRRAWTSDPAIRDFIGIAENQWDFTDPTAMPGFGPLETAGDLPKLVAEAMGKLAEAPGTIASAEESSLAVAAEDAGKPAGSPAQEAADDQNTIEVVASQHPEAAPSDVTGPRRKGHGGALPR